MVFAEEDPDWWDRKIKENELRDRVIDLCFHAEPEVALKVKDLYTKPLEPGGSDDEEELGRRDHGVGHGVDAPRRGKRPRLEELQG